MTRFSCSTFSNLGPVQQSSKLNSSQTSYYNNENIESDDDDVEPVTTQSSFPQTSPSPTKVSKKPITKQTGRFNQQRATDEVFKDLSNKIGAYFDTIGNADAKVQPTNPISPEEAFGKFVGMQLAQIPQSEIFPRQQKIIEALGMPLAELNQ